MHNRKNNISIIFFILLFLLAAPSFCFCGTTVELKTWYPYQGIKSISFEANALKIESGSAMPILISQDTLFIDSKKHTFLVLKIKTEKSYSTARLFFKRIGDSDFNINSPQVIPLALNGLYHTYVVNLKGNPLWNGVVNRLVFQPTDTVEKVEIGDMRLEEGNLLLSASSMWQEFFRFEHPVPLTINLLYGPKISGTSINAHIYVLILLVFIIICIYAFIKYHDLSTAIVFITSRTLITCLVFWVLLDMRWAMDQLRAAKVDFDVFHGKSLDERHALATYGNYYDFYYFIRFCGSKMPAASTFSLNVPPYFYYMHEKAKYYLYPTYEKADGAYLLVYDPDNYFKGELPKGYRPFATYKPGQYILKGSSQ